ncbi:transglutaminase-like domain-containing protein [Actinomycetes bacterium M1A6_2h]
MQIRVGFEMSFECPVPTPMILNLNIHYSRMSDLLGRNDLLFDPPVPMSVYRDDFGNWCTRIIAPAGPIRITSDTVVHDSGLVDAYVPDAYEVPVHDLPAESLVFLLGSRYCETDRLMQTAWNLFGNGPSGWARVQAICDYVHNHITFDYQLADNTRTALGAFEQRVGVCRDFAHLAVALCRAMNIPARYCTGYVGDIGIPANPAPMDFAAWFEAYLGGQWYTFDPRNNTPLIGRVLIARGRDAADVALTNSFGTSWLTGFTVWTDEVRSG